MKPPLELLALGQQLFDIGLVGLDSRLVACHLGLVFERGLADLVLEIGCASLEAVDLVGGRSQPVLEAG